MNIKWFPKSLTIWFGVLWILVGIANNFGYLNYHPSDLVQEILLVVNGIIIILLRIKTNRPISIKRPFLDQLTDK